MSLEELRKMNEINKERQQKIDEYFANEKAKYWVYSRLLKRFIRTPRFIHEFFAYKLNWKVMKYAEEAGATCEEMKHGIEQVINEITGILRLLQQDVKSDYIYGEIAALGNALDIIKGHLYDYLDLDD